VRGKGVVGEIESQKVRVSVIIPTYNRADLLKEAIDSVLEQTWREFEVIVVDDGSTDATGDAVRPYGGRVRYVYKENGGPSSARNVGIREAKGTYVAFLDSDDLWEPEKLKVQMGFMLEHPEVKLTCTDSSLIGSGGKRERRLSRDLVGNLFPLLYSNSFVRTSTVVMARECFQEIGYFDERYRSAEDYDLWLRVARRYPIAYLSRPLVRYRKQEDNVSRDKLTLRLNALQILDSHYDPRVIPPSRYRMRISDLEIYCGRAYLRVGDLGKAREAFGRSWRLTPFRFRPFRYWLGAWLKASGKP